jgi:ABC-type lipoprotein export system ATPase subunit
VWIQYSGLYAQIIVEDTGPGIPYEELPRIFDRFYRGRTRHENKGDGISPGIGIGLSLAKAIAEAHGGTISAQPKGAVSYSSGLNNPQAGAKFIPASHGRFGQTYNRSCLCGRENIYSMSDSKLAVFRRRQIGFVFQFYNLIPVLTARENIALPLLLDNKQGDDGRIDQLLDHLNLTDRSHHMPSELSGGQQQRVSIGRALAARPSIIMADEPTGNLDRTSGNEILELLRVSVNYYRQTVVMITHDLDAAKKDNSYNSRSHYVCSSNYLCRNLCAKYPAAGDRQYKRTLWESLRLC